MLLGLFTTVPFEKECSKLPSKIRLHLSYKCPTAESLLLNQNVNIDAFDVKPGHQCTSCDDKLYEEGSEIFVNPENLEPSLSDEIKMALMYIAGYITINDNQPSEYGTHYYYDKYRKYINSIDCEKLKVLSEMPMVIFFVSCFFIQ